MAETAVHPAEGPDTETPVGDMSVDGGVVLRRLLAVTTLTPQQAGLLALDLVGSLERLHDERHHPGRLTDRSTVVSDDGTLAVHPESPAADQDAEWQPTATAATDLVQRIVANARRGGSRRQPAATALADRCAGAPQDLTELTTRVRNAVSSVLDVDDGARLTRTRKELAALVAATKGRPPTDTAARGDQPTLHTMPEVPRSIMLAPESWRPSSRRSWHRRTTLRDRKTLLIGLVVVLVLGAVGWGVPRAWVELRRGWEAVFTPKPVTTHLVPVSPPAEAPRAEGIPPPPVRLPAPKRADPVSAVTITATGSCTPGTACPVRVDVQLRPTASAHEVRWVLRVVDRCAGKTYPRSGVSIDAAPWARQVYGISRPIIPTRSALAIFAVTESPARAASPPLLIPATHAIC